MTNAESTTAPASEWNVDVPPGWEPVAGICRAVFRDLPHVTNRINAAITQEIPEFAPAESVFTARDLAWTTSRNTASFLRGIAENRGPTADEMAFRRMIGQRSALRGFPFQPLIASFHIAYRELWSMMVEHAAAIGGRAPMMLLGEGSTIWRWMHATTSSIGEGYNQETARREAFATRAAAHLIDAIAQDPASDECASLAIELGFRPQARFRMLALVGPIASVDTAESIASAIRRRGGVTVSAQRGRNAVILTQGAALDLIDESLPRRDDPAPIGVGLERHGLQGASASLIEAERALALAVLRGGVCRFEDDWLPAIALAHRDSIEPMFESGIQTATFKPHLADAITAFARSGYSVAEGARSLRLSQNSFRYRLTRWRSLTGWDPWTHDGLTRSLIALEFSPRTR